MFDVTCPDCGKGPRYCPTCGGQCCPCYHAED